MLFMVTIITGSRRPCFVVSDPHDLVVFESERVKTYGLQVLDHSRPDTGETPKVPSSEGTKRPKTTTDRYEP